MAVRPAPTPTASSQLPKKPVPVIREGFRQVPPDPPKRPKLAANKPEVEPKQPKATPKPRSLGSSRSFTGESIKGTASWYCNYDNSYRPRSVCHYRYPDGPGRDMYAAACLKLRRAMGSDWRGNRVSVTSRGRTILVRLVDWCGSTTKLIDLYSDAAEALGFGGTRTVRVSWR